MSQDGERLLVKFDADALDAVLPLIPAQGLVQNVRIADPVSLAIDLGPRFGAFRATAQPLDTAARMMIDIVAAQTDTPAPGVSPSPAPGASASPAAPASPAPLPDLSSVGQAVSAIRTIAIDPGHGAEDAGVVGPGGTKEKDLTLAVARRLKAALEGRLGHPAYPASTRDDDPEDGDRRSIGAGQ